MEEAQELSDHVGIMDHGKLVAVGTQRELVKSVGELDRIQLRLIGPAESLLETWKTLEGIHDVTSDDGIVTVLAADSNRVLPRLFESAAGSGVRIASVDVQEPNLEAVFLRLTGRALRD
jgi:ABC-2 type transport system ATP-binding protein